MTGHRVFQLAALLATSLLWASVAEAQRPGAEPRRGRPEPQGRTQPSAAGAVRQHSLPDLNCTIGLFERTANSETVIPNGSELTWALQGGTGRGGAATWDPIYWVRATITNSGPGEARFHPGIGISNNGAKVPSSATTWDTLPGFSSRTYGPYKVGPLPEGTHTIIGRTITDVGNFQAETIETNNVCEFEVTIKPPPAPPRPDLVCYIHGYKNLEASTAIEGSEVHGYKVHYVTHGMHADHFVVLRLRVRNQGPDTAFPPASVSFSTQLNGQKVNQSDGEWGDPPWTIGYADGPGGDSLGPFYIQLPSSTSTNLIQAQATVQSVEVDDVESNTSNNTCTYELTATVYQDCGAYAPEVCPGTP